MACVGATVAVRLSSSIAKLVVMVYHIQGRVTQGAR